MATTGSLGRLCKRFGPGRLPGAEKRDVGAGYAFATAALSAVVVFVVVTGFEPILNYGLGAFGPAHGGIYMFGVYAVPFVVPSAFVAGALAWEIVPQSARYGGELAGVFATMLTYVIATPLAMSVWYLVARLHPEVTVSTNPLGLVGVFAFFGFVTTFWVTLPLGALTGRIHERAVETN